MDVGEWRPGQLELCTWLERHGRACLLEGEQRAVALFGTPAMMPLELAHDGHDTARPVVLHRDERALGQPELFGLGTDAELACRFARAEQRLEQVIDRADALAIAGFCRGRHEPAVIAAHPILGPKDR